MKFEKITGENLGKIKKYFDSVDYGTCDLTPLCVYFWGTDRYCFAEENGALFIRMCFKGGFKGYFPPVCDKKDFCNRVEDVVSRGGKTVFFGITEELFSLLEEGAKQGRFDVLEEPDRDYSDYVYSADDLAYLKGKKFSKKRNLIHQFSRDYQSVTFSETKAEDIPSIEAFLRDYERGDLDENERQEIKRIFGFLKSGLPFGAISGLLKDGKRTVAFAVGEIKGEVMYTHVEKADRNFKGAYQAINMFFSRLATEKYGAKYINREDDSGDAGLRQAKLSYNPVRLVKKYMVTVSPKKKNGKSAEAQKI